LPANPPKVLAPMWRTAVRMLMLGDPRGQLIIVALRQIELMWRRRRIYARRHARVTGVRVWRVKLIAVAVRPVLAGEV
jgi:hypothetical protein